MFTVSQLLAGFGERMEIIVGSVKAFVRLCNKKDFSHLPYARLVEWHGEWLGRSDHVEEVFGGDESEPLKIAGSNTHMSTLGRVTSQGSVEEDSDEEFSSTEDSFVSQSQKRKRRNEKKRSDERKRTEPMLFELEI